ncbi:hypothetical protein A3E44_00985 [Candidatus Woesebacteria bacterium RIFCSPHIGHO2_12_FULL_41_24]|uniref:Uncharacterized protein n=1 Tax=Candidatus Woesebacteria bacterium RIFCSPHIGHO2_12_FULL_41_24 TaxID=1802510 RepID=A0A1F8AW55_9BACT|nr:MAG: hypothetical protein A2W15_00545 [Candidatus Woesebacteria bacterium RBG_16_41_13]OGM55478.1 MAG: hypothetical protein A3E44_00985 [Candidatus Woesebacteria bacterium RIFCSPHIGHO2_12_FULL_41_24]
MEMDIANMAPKSVKSIKINYWIFLVILLVVAVISEAWYIRTLQTKPSSGKQKDKSIYRR